MEELILDVNTKYDSNVVVYQCGWEDCAPGHSYGPAVRDHYLIHFVLSGKGRYHFNNEVFEITSNQGFLICPNDITYYEADAADPWSYIWVGFNGIKAHQYIKQIGIGKCQPVIHTRNSDFVRHCLHEIFQASRAKKGREVRMLGYLYLLLSTLIEESESNTDMSYKDEYISKAVEYIEMNYHRNVSIQDTSAFLGLNRSYFSNLFKMMQGASPQQFLIQYRISKACELMKSNHRLSVGDVSRSVGYSDPLMFSKTFKKIKGISPREYMKDVARQS